MAVEGVKPMVRRATNTFSHRTNFKWMKQSRKFNYSWFCRGSPRSSLKGPLDPPVGDWGSFGYSLSCILCVRPPVLSPCPAGLLPGWSPLWLSHCRQTNGHTTMRWSANVGTTSKTAFTASGIPCLPCKGKRLVKALPGQLKLYRWWKWLKFKLMYCGVGRCVWDVLFVCVFVVCHMFD